jgi:hypothetical protein
MDDRKRTAHEFAQSMLARIRDDVRAAYAAVRQEHGEHHANTILRDVGLAVGAALARCADFNVARGTPAAAQPPAPPADEDSFG